MKTCTYCGRENDDAVAVCHECGTEFSGDESMPSTALRSRRGPIILAIGALLLLGAAAFSAMHLLLLAFPVLVIFLMQHVQDSRRGRVIKGIGGCFSGLCVVVFLLFLIVDSILTPNYPTPKRGYNGEWRPWNAFPVEERPLPRAAMLWSNYEAWCAHSDEIVTRLYLARMGRADRQSNFQVRHDRTRGMPLGDYVYTSVSFDYHDPTNGVYHLHWSLPGRHSPDFLRFNDEERLFLLQASGSEDRVMLSVHGVEGTRPFYGSPREFSKTNRIKQGKGASRATNPASPAETPIGDTR